MPVQVKTKSPVEIKRLDERAEPWPFRGRWRCHKKEGKRFAALCCPNCGEVYAVGHMTHAISSTGLVTPAFECIASGCGFHEAIRLKDWVP